jgi:hypothetical protein
MRDQYKILFTTELLHSYYTDGKCSDLAIEPVSSTKKLLSGHQMLSRSRGNTGTVLFRADENDDPFIEVATGTILTFAMYVKERQFTSITKSLPARGYIKLYTNTTDTAGTDGKIELDAEDVLLSGTSISYTITSNNEVSITLEDADGNELDERTYAAGSKDEQHRFDISVKGAGLYKVTENDGTTVKEAWYYADAELASANVMGVIRITNRAASPFPYSTSRKYKISFTPVSNKWSYYIVAPNLSNADFATLSVADQGHTTADDTRPQITFTKISPIPTSNKIPGYLTTNTGRVMLFESTVAVVLRQKPRKQIKLLKNGSELIGNLPNPAPDAANAEMYVYV